MSIQSHQLLRGTSLSRERCHHIIATAPTRLVPTFMARDSMNVPFRAFCYIRHQSAKAL